VKADGVTVQTPGAVTDGGIPYPCKIFSIVGYNSGAGQIYILVFDSATKPAEGAVPRWVANAFGKAPWSFDVGDGAIFDNGCWICRSSTDVTKTMGVTADQLMDVEWKRAAGA
jgi:hypothetical protein